MEAGLRVAAISHMENGTVYLFGYGVYEGDFYFGHDDVPAGAVAEITRKKGAIKNPRIRLDNGKVVWGCECWWGAEEKFKDKYVYSGNKIVEVDIDQARAQRK